MKLYQEDPQRWADRADGPTIDDRVGADIRKMGEPVVPDDHVLARVHQRVLATPARRPPALRRLAIAFGLALVFVGGAVSAQLGHFPFGRPRGPAVDELSVPEGSTVRLRGKRHRQIALVGPAEITVGNSGGDTDSIAVREGLVAINAGDQPLAISVDGASVTVPAGSLGTVAVTGTGQPEASALAGTVHVTFSRGATTLNAGQSWRHGITAAAEPDQLDRAVRALADGPGGAVPASVPSVPLVAAQAQPVATGPTVAVSPAAVPVAPMPERRPGVFGSEARPPLSKPSPSSAPSKSTPRVPATAPVALALVASPAINTSAARPLAPPPAPPPFPAPALPVQRALPPPSVSPLVAANPPPDGELALIAAAVRRLRTDNDPQGALAVLNEHRTRFPSGALTREANLARVEALLALDRRGEALRVLDGAAIGELPRARAVRTTRGELRAELGHCADAVKDFDLLLSANQHDAFAERALYGRAACRARAGEGAGARADLLQYRTLYPQGRFAGEVGRLLKGR